MASARRVTVLMVVCLALLAGCQSIRTALGDMEVVELREPLWQDAYSTWTPSEPAQYRHLPRVNRSVTGTPLSVNKLSFEHGISVAGDAFLAYSLDSRASHVKLLMGIDDESSKHGGTATVDIRGDGVTLVHEELTAGRDPVSCGADLQDVHQLLICVRADTNVVTDIVLPQLTGLLGLRAALVDGKQANEQYLFEQPATHEHPSTLPNGSVLFPCQYGPFGPCLALSNQFVCLVVSAQHGGRVMHCGPSMNENFLEGGSGVSLHPVDRLIVPAQSMDDRVWRWKIDDDGSLRLLSPPDVLNGVRWSRTFRLDLDSPYVHSTVLVKNIVQHNISWSAGTTFAFPPSMALVLASPNEQATWFTATRGDELFRVQANEPKHGYYPYNGLRVRLNGTGVTVLGELTVLGPGEHSVQEQEWRVERAGADVSTPDTGVTGNQGEQP